MYLKESKQRKNLHKILLLVIKTLPMLISVFYLLNTVLTYMGKNTIIISFISGVYIIPLVFMYLCSMVFKFCFYHRMFLHYILICNIITYLDYKCKLPLTEFELLMLYMIISGISLFLILYAYVTRFNKGSITKNFR